MSAELLHHEQSTIVGLSGGHPMQNCGSAPGTRCTQHPMLQNRNFLKQFKLPLGMRGCSANMQGEHFCKATLNYKRRK